MRPSWYGPISGACSTPWRRHRHSSVAGFFCAGDCHVASRTVLAVGRLTEQKGFDVLLEAWARVARQHPDWRLRIVGWGEDENALKAQAWTLGLSESVVFVGRTSRVEEEYQRAALFAMSSRWEGLPMTLLEAQSFGLPVVSTNCETGPAEILQGGSGVLVDVEDAAALARELCLLIEDAPRRQQMSLLARENAARFDADVLCDEWQQLLARMLPGLAQYQKRAGEQGASQSGKPSAKHSLTSRPVTPARVTPICWWP
ncbi:hypothetical protein CU110_05675 [Cobetia sp. ICG0124]|nr:hypothetical protein CU110_05675 [Cobetia sp. ICG0124]